MAGGKALYKNFQEEFCVSHCKAHDFNCAQCQADKFAEHLDVFMKESSTPSPFKPLYYKTTFQVYGKEPVVLHMPSLPSVGMTVHVGRDISGVVQAVALKADTMEATVYISR